MFAAVSWWLVIEVLGWLALPLAWRVCMRLPGRGYPQAKAIGVLAVSYLLWLGASFRLLPNDFGGILVADRDGGRAVPMARAAGPAP